MLRRRFDNLMRLAVAQVRKRTAGLPGRARSAAVAAILRPEPVHTVCPECAVDFVANLTNSRCPICGWMPEQRAAARLARGGDRRFATGLGFAWFAGAVIFALVAHFLYA
jgi:hypothetical protein